MTNHALFAVGLLIALGVGFLIPRKSAEEFCERAVERAFDSDTADRTWARIAAIILFAIFYSVMEGLTSQYSYGVIGLLTGFGINIAIFLLLR